MHQQKFYNEKCTSTFNAELDNVACFKWRSRPSYNRQLCYKNVQTGMLLRMKDANNANGTPLVAYEPVNWKCMTWDFKHVVGETYQLQNLLTNKTFQSKDGSPSNGAVLVEQPLVKAQANQQYDFILLDKNVYLIKATGTELYLTPVDKNGTTNTGITLAAKNGSKLQQWTIYEQSPTM